MYKLIVNNIILNECLLIILKLKKWLISLLFYKQNWIFRAEGKMIHKNFVLAVNATNYYFQFEDCDLGGQLEISFLSITTKYEWQNTICSQIVVIWFGWWSYVSINKQTNDCREVASWK